jgi:allantoinase
MADASLVVRGALVVAPGSARVADVVVEEGVFVAIEPESSMRGRHEIDARGKVLFPGWVDAHVHFNDPGRECWEGLDSGPAALAAGGGTVFIDMPLNSHPPVLNRESLLAKRARGEAVSRLDFALWGGLTPDSLPHLDAMADEGVVGFKAFLCPSGIDEFGAADARVLKAGMSRAAARGLVISVHAEDPDFIAAHQRKYPPPSPGSMRDWLDSRPPEAERRAIALAVDLAGETGCKLHIVHVSSPEGMEAALAGRAAGVDVSIETCPHYLLIDDRMAERIGVPAKCAPPLRDAARVGALWQSLEAGEIDTIGSDHSPAPPEMKSGEDVFAAWGGIAGCQHGFPLLLEPGLPRIPWPRWAEVMAGNPARRFGLADRKGGVAVGFDADFCLLQREPSRILADDLLYRHAVSAYIGMSLAWRICGTWSRGRPVGAESRGRFLKPH